MKKILLYIALVTVTAASCTQGEAPDGGVPSSVPVQLQAVVDAGSVVSRAATSLQEGAMGIYRTTAGGYEAITNVRYSYNTSTAGWESDDPADKAKTMYVDHRDATLFAYYPYTATAAADGVFSLGLKRYKAEEEVLYSGAVTGVSNRAAALTLNMKRAYSRLTVRLRNNYASVVTVKKMTLTPGSGSFVSDGTIDISAVTPATQAGSATVPSYSFPYAAADAVNTTGIATGVADETVDMLWIPQALPDGLNVDVRLDFEGIDTPMQASVRINSASLPKLEPGCHYVLPLVVRQTGTLEFTAVELKDWSTATVAETEVKEP